MSSVTHAVQMVRQLMIELGMPQRAPTVIFGDNQPSLHVAHSTGASEMTRHIDVRFHHVRERVARGEVVFRYVSTEQQVADVLTKPLANVKHTEFAAELLGMLSS